MSFILADWAMISQELDDKAGWSDVRQDGNTTPHIHCLLMAAPSYFWPNYLSQERWVNQAKVAGDWL